MSIRSDSQPFGDALTETCPVPAADRRADWVDTRPLAEEVFTDRVPRSGTGTPQRTKVGVLSVLAERLQGANHETAILGVAQTFWFNAFRTAARFTCHDGFVQGAAVRGVPEHLSTGFEQRVLRIRDHWLLSKTVGGRESYCGPGSAVIGTTWVTDQLGLDRDAEVAVLPIENARRHVVGLLVGHHARIVVGHTQLMLLGSAIHAAHLRVAGERALERLRKSGR